MIDTKRNSLWWVAFFYVRGRQFLWQLLIVKDGRYMNLWGIKY